MSYVNRALDLLASQSSWGYQPECPAAEPTAYAALALAAYGRDEAAGQARQWLALHQRRDDSVGALDSESSPGWPTPLAILAWSLPQNLPVNSPSRSGSGTCQYDVAIKRASAWLLSIEGETSQQPEFTGHDTGLVGWPWVSGTHSWIEPTALALLALKATGRDAHPRARAAENLLLDRLLPGGGCNYGNTIVLGQELLPHVQPSGLAMLALRGVADRAGRVQKTLAYLESDIGPATTPVSLAFGLLGLAAHEYMPPQAEAWLAAAIVRSMRRNSSWELALLCLAALGKECPMIIQNPVASAT